MNLTVILMDDLGKLYLLDRGSFSFSDREGETHQKNMFIPSIIALLYTERTEDESGFDFQCKIISAFLSSQYDFMNVEWVKNNIDLGQQNEIFHRIETRFMEDQEQLKKSLEARVPLKTPKKK